MAKDPAFLFYPGDASEDTQFMNRLERGAYFDLLKAQKKFRRFTLEQIKKVLGQDFDACWPAIELVLAKDSDGYYIEWVDEKIKAREAFSESRRRNRKKKSSEQEKKSSEQHMNNISSSSKEDMVNGNGNGNGNDKDITKIVVESTRSPAFHSAWQEWKDYRKEIKKPYRSRKTELAQLHKLASYSDEEAIKMIEQSIRQGWQGIFPVVPERNNNQHPNPGKI